MTPEEISDLEWILERAEDGNEHEVPLLLKNLISEMGHMRNEIHAEIQRLRAENERLRRWLERIAETRPGEGTPCTFAQLALAGEPA